MARLSIFLILVIIGLAITCNGQPVQQFNGNLFVDGIMASLKFAYGDKMNSLDLPEQRVKFSNMIGFINVTAEGRLYQGHLTGFSSIHRTSDAMIRFLNKGKQISIVVKLGAEKLGLSYTGKISMMVS